VKWWLVIGGWWLIAGCSRGEVPTTPTDTRDAIEVSYVTAPQLRVHAQPNDSSPVITTYENSEGISIMSRRGEWVEVRTGDRTGWVHAGDLGSAAEAKEQQEKQPVRFRRFPAPVSNPGAHGAIYFEADVNTDGDVTAVRILENTTGSDVLAAQNAAALQAAKFYPIVKNGERKPFKYMHRVSY
jgi:outer membrane biosynthesis protein TonB